MLLVAEHPEERRRWRGWAIIDQYEEFYRVQLTDPAENEPLQKLLSMGWQAIPVEVVER